ncbi:LysR family transcriptional regulator [Nocardia sp. NPDC005825]|uniref:LysR family transcriptional regulator n=1 Tax=unclassified Nocardia TaxID=2637762 RepID=UPI0033E038B6
MKEDRAAATIAPGLAQLAALGVEQSITRAAIRSQTSQPTLSRALRRWEEAVGTSLVEEDGRGIRLTAAGALLTAAAAEALETLASTIRTLTDNRAVQHLTIAYLRSLGPSVVVELVPSFLETHPDVVVAHRESSTAAVLEAVEVGDIDIAVTSPKPPDHFHWLPLGTQPIVLMLHTSHPLASRTEISLAEVADEPFLVLDRRFHTRQLTDAICSAAGIDPHIRLEADDLLTIANYVAAGLGVGVVPADSQAHPRTVSVPITDRYSRRTFGLVWSPSNDREALAAFVTHARTLGERYPGWADIEA